MKKFIITGTVHLSAEAGTRGEAAKLMGELPGLDLSTLNVAGQLLQDWCGRCGNGIFPTELASQTGDDHVCESCIQADGLACGALLPITTPLFGKTKLVRTGDEEEVDDIEF